IQTMVDIGLAILRQARKLIPITPPNTIDWTVIFTMHYDALHQFTDAFLRFDRIKSSNHQCLFAYLCEKHPELEFDWGFLEEIRTKRNGVHYYGTPVSHSEWKRRELQINLYITTLRKAIEQALLRERGNGDDDCA
ncbi:MAG TPA: hypothetical protein VJH22_05770, partial [Candidatus Nanoarchaeia archaeon]|nr:hypothetical protein [Candidatus Nanoarchaeia archaeon]